jgi:hypothetical protein
MQLLSLLFLVGGLLGTGFFINDEKRSSAKFHTPAKTFYF